MLGRNTKHQLAQLVAAGLIALLALPAQAERADRDQEIHADFDRSSVEQKTGTSTYTFDGDVHVTQGTLAIVSDHAVSVKGADDNQHITAVGHPATFRERMENGIDWLDGHSDRIEYDQKTGDVKLIGNAWVRRAQDELTGAIVTYNTNTEVYTTDGSAKSDKPGGPTMPGRGHLIIQPKKKPTATDKPAQAAQAAAPAAEPVKP
jgi:lipopolysaccharide export system protein LptA